METETYRFKIKALGKYRIKFSNKYSKETSMEVVLESLLTLNKYFLTGKALRKCGNFLLIFTPFFFHKQSKIKIIAPKISNLLNNF